MRGLWLAIPLLLVAMMYLPSCGATSSKCSPGGRPAGSAAPASAVHQDTGQPPANLSGEELVERSLALATALPAFGEAKGAPEPGTVYELAGRLAALSEWKVLDRLARELTQERRKAVITALLAVDEREGARSTLASLSRTDPANLWLAPYRVGGIEYLLMKAEDLAASPSVRRMCLVQLGRYADTSAIPRLVRLADDTTQIVEPMEGGGIGEAEYVVGDYARLAVEAIKARAGE